VSYDAELIVVSGPLLGARFPLGAGVLRIGRDESSDILIADSGAAREHCIIDWRDGRYRIADRHTGAGTYVNGMRITEHSLEPGDQVSIGETVLLYREDGAAGPDTSQAAGEWPQADQLQQADQSQPASLLRACSLLFLFRALAMSQGTKHRATLEDQILRLIGDIVPSTGGAVLLGSAPEEFHERSVTLGVDSMIGQVCREGAVIDLHGHTVALALYVRGAVSGVLVIRFPEEQSANLADHRDTLSVIATLAGAALETVRDVERLQAQNALLMERIAAVDTGIVGESACIGKLLQMIARLAPQDTSVLILGESGTGKELVARALHRQSPRAGKPFVAINCAALTETLLESELFGHEKGAFTGAVAQKKGKLEAAEGGIVFLDEIGELAPTLQAKLLRVLQQREFERVGGIRSLPLDVRIIAATNRDLNAEVRAGTFREDLYHRLNVVSLRVPPLRDHPEDIPVLSQYFLGRATARCRRRVSGISPEAGRYLNNYSWPGNVRELENAIERAVVLGQADLLLPEDLPETVLESAGVPEVPGALQSTMTQTKRQSIIAAWQQAGGDHRQAAVLLNIHPNSLRRLIRSLHMRDVLP
jgi:two-component system response regulator HydG